MIQGGYNNPIPQFAPEDDYLLPIDLGGRVANYPIVTHLQQWGLSHEQVVGDTTTLLLGDNVDAAEGYAGPNGSFQGDVWSIQLTARPGYYVAPEVQQELGWIDNPAWDGPNG